MTIGSETLSLTVLCGGASSEREISLKSGKAVFKALSAHIKKIWLVDARESFMHQIRVSRTNFVFIALHGKFGEDGQLQAILEKEKIRFSGSGSEASRLAMDKALSREAFVREGLDVPEGRSWGLADRITGIPEFPVVVKPASGGSSIGISIARNTSELERALSLARSEDPSVVIERWVPGREFTVGILGEEALGPIEVVTGRDFFDYEAKYVDAGTQYIVNPSISPALKTRLLDAGLKAHRALGLKVFSRADLILGDDGRIYVLEVNSIPGLTERSLLPKMAQERGLAFDALCLKIVSKSLEPKGESLAWANGDVGRVRG